MTTEKERISGAETLNTMTDGERGTFTACRTCGVDFGRAYDKPIRCDSCCTEERLDNLHQLAKVRIIAANWEIAYDKAMREHDTYAGQAHAYVQECNRMQRQLDADQGELAEMDRLRQLRKDCLDALDGEMGSDADDGSIVSACVEWKYAVRLLPEGMLDPEVDTLQEVVEKLLSDLESAHRKMENVKGDLERVTRERDIKAIIVDNVRTDIHGVWFWQGDGDDHPEALSCPVVMSAETLRKFVADLEAARQANAVAEGRRETLDVLEYVAEKDKRIAELEQRLAESRSEGAHARTTLGGLCMALGIPYASTEATISSAIAQLREKSASAGKGEALTDDEAVQLVNEWSTPGRIVSTASLIALARNAAEAQRRKDGR
jgi:hypothetical protein